MSEPAETLISVAGYLRFETEKVRGSRFIASVDRCVNAADLGRLLERVRAEFPDASHHCFAWRGESAQAKRCSDDREPFGSAGIPMLKALEGRDLYCTGVVVTRYFGGTKLGVGGLVRAYGGAAGQSLDLAEKIERPIVRRFEICFDYAFQGMVESQRNAFAASVVDSSFGQSVTLQVEVARRMADDFCTGLRDACSGSIEIKELGVDPHALV